MNACVNCPTFTSTWSYYHNDFQNSKIKKKPYYSLFSLSHRQHFHRLWGYRRKFLMQFVYSAVVTFFPGFSAFYFDGPSKLRVVFCRDHNFFPPCFPYFRSLRFDPVQCTVSGFLRRPSHEVNVSGSIELCGSAGHLLWGSLSCRFAALEMPSWISIEFSICSNKMWNSIGDNF